MPFINVELASQKLAQGRVERIQAAITTLLTDIPHKVGLLVGVPVAEVPLGGGASAPRRSMPSSARRPTQPRRRAGSSPRRAVF